MSKRHTQNEPYGNIPQWLHYLKSGKEGDIYTCNQYAFKVYPEHTKWMVMENEFRFLEKYQHTSVVPKVYSDLETLKELNVIVMDYLRNYKPLKLVKSGGLTAKQKETLLRSLVYARYRLGENVTFTDLHSDNVLVSDDLLSVKFIDAGKEYHHGSGWIDWLSNISNELGATRTPIGKLIKSFNAPALKKIVELDSSTKKM